MSVDYYSCECCGDARYEEAIQECPSCGRSICDECLNDDVETPARIEEREDITYEQYKDLCEKYGKELIDDSVIDGGELNPEYCPFCSGKEVCDDDLLDFAIRELNTTKTELTKKYKEDNINGK